jgi:hypothetical protein
MAGLMPKAQMSGPADGRMGETQSAEARSTDQESNVTPEEQAQYDQFVGNALRIISSDKTRQGLLKTLAGNGRPQEGLANTAVMIAKRVVDSARENGVEISGDVLLHGGVQVVEALADVQEAAGIAELSEEEVQGAMYRAADLYREISQSEGTLNTDAAKEDMQALAAADRAGRLDELLPGLDQMQGGA